MKKTYIKPTTRVIPNTYDDGICQIIVSSQGLEGGSEAKPGNFYESEKAWGDTWEDPATSKAAKKEGLEW